MLVLEAKLVGKNWQYERLDEAIRTGQFVRNKCLAYWIESSRDEKVNRCLLNKLALELKKEFEWASKLNSQAAQAHAERAWSAISRFFDNCKKKAPGKKGYPKFKKNSRSVEYKITGWNLSEDKKKLTLTDDFNSGTFKLKGTRDLSWYTKKQIKRVRIVRRAKGYFVQFCIDVERSEPLPRTNKFVGIDLGIKEFYTDSNGEVVNNPRYLRKSELRLKRRQRRKSARVKGSKNRLKAIKKLGRAHFKVSSQRKDFAVKTAKALIQSNDMVVYEDLKVRNMVKNHKLAKSISDASWSMFTDWLDYFGKVHGRIVFSVAPHWTSQNCSNCGELVKKSLSTRTHQCPKCQTVLDRDHNAAINILNKGWDDGRVPQGMREFTLEESGASGRVEKSLLLSSL
ncbi:MAG: IS200/IS605 family element transposase accessory protein TnpB [Symploca sp. SIO1C4]|uniref:IS200/IS605 family element transposase accessory protein TnpB n=2 Tax=Symploca sp. SIO1C4 TaxID=2607765 RepID=A0A6B3NN54_9CYAN|nr:IS200/IS605 family element transposase accessory protein TnpB [Symploca sp. SIO1C4]